MSTTDEIQDIMDAIGLDDSEYDSSGDEYIPSKADLRELEEEEMDDDGPCTSKRTAKKRKRETEWDEEDDIPLATLQDDIPLARIRQNDKNGDWEEEDVSPLASFMLEEVDGSDQDLQDAIQTPVWTEGPFEPPKAEFTGDLEHPPEGELKTPYQYYKYLITDEMLKKVEDQTNLYSVQQHGTSINTTQKEIEIFIGIYLRMGLIKAHCVRAYWDSKTHYDPVASTMAREKFKKLASHLHFVDNSETKEENKVADKLWKIRPWIDNLRDSFCKIPAEEHNSVDKIMVPFKGHSSLKMFMKSKPHKWGFKMWGRCGSSGILYQFDVYQGSCGKNQQKRSPYGVGGGVVLKMTSKLEEGKGYKVFADNFFTNLPLCGSFESNRLPRCNLASEKELKREGRGSHSSKVELHLNTITVRWFDNKNVDLVSSYTGIEPQTTVQRWDKKAKSRVAVKRPAIVQEYNKFMGGVDLLDSLTALYKFPMKSRRWYMYIFLHTLAITCVNAWLWYKRHCALLHMKPVKLSDFQSEVADALILCKRPVGRPAAASPPPPAPVKVSKRKPVSDVRFDNTDHLPVWGVRGCRQRGQCTGQTFIKCIKCNVFLCLNKDRSCFLNFHKK